MRLARIVVGAAPAALVLVACGSDVWLGDLPQAQSLTNTDAAGGPIDGAGATTDGASGPADVVVANADVVAPPPDGATTDASAPDADADADADADVADAAADAAAEAGPDADPCSAKDCKGQACVNGLCQPIALATGQPGPGYLAMDFADIFWGTTGHAGVPGDQNVVAKTSRAPGGPVIVLNADGGAVRGIAVDNTQVHYLRQMATGATLGRASKVDGSGATFTGFFPGATNVQGLAFDGTSLLAVNGTEVRAFLPTDVTASGTQLVGGLGAGGSAVNELDALIVADPGGSAVDVITKSTRALQQVGGLGDVPVDVAIDSGYVYFAAKTVVGRFSRTTFAVETIATGLDGAAGITVDPSNVYFSTRTALWSAPKGTTNVTKVTDGLTQAGHLLVDATYLYFADFGQGVIGRVPK